MGLEIMPPRCLGIFKTREFLQLLAGTSPTPQRRVGPRRPSEALRSPRFMTSTCLSTPRPSSPLRLAHPLGGAFLPSWSFRPCVP